MPFFQQPTYLTPEATFFHHLLSSLDLDPEKLNLTLKAHPYQRSHLRRCAPAETYTPPFDITETPTAYNLYGELPGVTQDDLSIEFADAQTIVIKGLKKRDVSSTLNSTSTTQHQEDATQEGENAISTSASTSSEKGKDKEQESDTSSTKSLNPTVEDDNDNEYDDVDAPITTPTSTSTLSPPTTSIPTPTPTPATESKPQSSTTTAKTWLAERKVGTFLRTFTFAQRIDSESVSAQLRDGMLRIVVPKSLGDRRIRVVVY